MAELGYTAHFVPGGGIVFENPDTPVQVAADRIWEDLRGIVGGPGPRQLLTRVQAGIKTGGQFAAETRSEPAGVTLT